MSKISELPTKINPVWNDLVTWLDSEDSNIQTKNKNFTISSIWDKTFTDKTTDNLSEWVSNLYYTDTRVDNNSTVVSLWVNKEDIANKSNDITSDTWSITKYPTVNAVENYVLSQWTNINWLTEETVIQDNDELIFYDTSSLWNKKIQFSNIKNDTLDWITQNWLITFESVSIWTSNWTVTSAWFLLNNISIWKITYNVSNSTTTLRLETSADNITWNTLYEKTTSSSNLDTMEVFMMQPWLYYRAYIQKSTSWVWSASVSLQYTT